MKRKPIERKIHTICVTFHANANILKRGARESDAIERRSWDSKKRGLENMKTDKVKKTLVELSKEGGRRLRHALQPEDV